LAQDSSLVTLWSVIMGNKPAPEPLPPLPQQQTVTIPGARFGALDGHTGRIVPPPVVQDVGHDRVKIPSVIDKASIELVRLAAPAGHQWRLEGAVSSTVSACTLTARFGVREVREAGRLRFEPCLDGPPAVQETFAQGERQRFSLAGVDLLHYPFETFWRVRRRGEQQITPIVLELHTEEATTLLYLAVQKSKAKNSLEAVVLQHKVIVAEKEYELQEIYGLASLEDPERHDESEAGQPCVVCISDGRDTAVLPCRHLCLCEGCALLLQQRTEKCPICRGKVEGLKTFHVK